MHESALTLLALAVIGVPSAGFAQGTDVSTTVEAPADPRHPTASVEVVELDQDAGDDLAAAVDDVPGVHARRTSYGQSAYVTIRGSNARQVLVETDGIRLNPPFGAGFDLSTAMLGFDSAAVWRGAAATYRGSGALAGALELRTRHLRRPGARIRASTLGGSYGTAAGTLDATVANESTSVRLATSARTSEGDFAFIDEQGTPGRRVNNDHERFGLFGSVDSRAGDAWVRATVFSSGGDRGTPGLVEFQEQFAAARLRDQQTAAIVGAGARDLVSGDDWAVDAAVRGAVQTRGYTYENPEPFLAGPAIYEETRSDSVIAGADAELWLPRSVGRIAADVRHETWEAEQGGDRLSFGTGTSWEQTVGAWLLAAAIRGDGDTDERFAVSPSAGAAVEVGAWSSRANVGRTFRTPNLDELYLDLESVRGNPDLVSEQAWIGDLGVAWSSELAQVSVTGFGRWVDSEILFLPVTAYLVEAQNVRGTWAAGVEASAGAEMGIFGAEIGYTWTHARFRESNVRLPLVPAHDLTARLSVAPSPVEVWTEGKLRGSITLDNFGNARDEAHVLWDAGVSVALDDRFEASLVARNLLDDRTMVDASQQPVPGRTMWVRLTATWEAH